MKLTGTILLSALALVGMSSTASATIHNVDANGLTFSPAELYIVSGDTVRWTVVSGFHTTTSSGGSSKIWDSGTMTAGQTYDVVFSVADGDGPFPYQCDLHVLSGMVGTIYIDNDNDNWSADIDCDDTNPNINPGATEICNGVDDNCDEVVDEGLDQTWYEDADDDGFGNAAVTAVDCSQPTGYVDNDLDCDDTDPEIGPCGGGCCLGSRGNANNDPEDKVNISDVTFMTAYLFGIPAGPAPVCQEEGNANGDPDEKINISDVTFLTAYLFGIPAGPSPPACP